MLVRLVAIILTVWEPLNLAWFVGPVLGTISTRGWATGAFLFTRLLVAGVGIAAGLSLWREAPHARRLAILALILSTIAAVTTFTTALLPTNIMPGDEWLYAGSVALFNGALVLVLVTGRPSG